MEVLCKYHGEDASEGSLKIDPTFVKVMNECIVAQFSLTHSVFYIPTSLCYTIVNPQIIRCFLTH